ncbi:CAN8 protein, partial [Emberiza fucata]|nr:CAN8 protein [Emberiza fucata]
TYWTNPQFKIQLDEPDDDHEGSLNEPCCTILVGLMQKNCRRQKRMEEGLLSIGYSPYQVKFFIILKTELLLESSTDVHAGHAFFARHQPAAPTDPCVNLHEVSSRMTLPRGQYCITPSTFEPYKNGEFCLRVFADNQAKSHYHTATADGSSETWLFRGVP